MPALLKLIPLRGWIYAAIALALFSFGLHYRAMEKQLAQVKVVATQAAVVVKTDEKQAATQEVQNAIVYTQAVHLPDVPDLGLKCLRDTPSRSPLPAANPVSPASPRVDAPVSGAGLEYDPSGAALTRARQADAQIAYLQARIKELEKEMENSP